MLLKARAEMIGKEPLRKAPKNDDMFSMVWEHVIKAPPQLSAEEMEAFNSHRQFYADQDEKKRVDSMAQEATPQGGDTAESITGGMFGDPTQGSTTFGQERPPAQAPPKGMGANFKAGQQETRDPNKKGMMGRFMDKFKRNPKPQAGSVEEAQATPPGLQPETTEEPPMVSWNNTPVANMSPTYKRWQQDRNTEPGQDFPSREYIRGRGTQEDLEQWDKWDAQQNPAVEAAQGAPPSLQPTDDGMDMNSSGSADAGFEAMGEQPDDGFYDRMVGEEGSQQTQANPPRYGDPKPGDFGTEISEWGRDVTPGQNRVYENWDYENNKWKPNAGNKQSQAPDAEFEEIPETKPLPTGGKGVKGLLGDNSPPIASEDRQLPQYANDEQNWTGDLVGPERGKRMGFNEVNDRNDDDKGKQGPGGRSQSGRLNEKNRREKAVADRSVDPTEAKKEPPKEKKATPAAKALAAVDEKKPAAKAAKAAKKATPAAKAAKKVSPAKAVANTPKGKEATKPDLLEQLMNKPDTQPPMTRGTHKPPSKKQATPAKAAKEVKLTPKTKAKAVKTTATKRAGQTGGKNVFQERANKQPARIRPKNPKKVPLAPASTAAAETRSNARAESKKNETMSDGPAKTYDKYISGSSSKDYVSEVVEAARSGNASAISRLKNDSGDLIDHHGMSEDELNEITG